MRMRRNLALATLAALVIGVVGTAVRAEEIVGAETIEKALTVRKTRGFRPVERKIDLRVEFELDSARLTPTARKQLDELANAMDSDALGADSFEIVGHTDATGPTEYNQELSEQRAFAVREYLSTERRITAARLHPSGRGEDVLLVPDDPTSGSNRRVEIVNMRSANP